MIPFSIMKDFPHVHVKMDIMVIHMTSVQISTNVNSIKYLKNCIGKLSLELMHVIKECSSQLVK